MRLKFDSSCIGFFALYARVCIIADLPMEGWRDDKAEAFHEQMRCLPSNKLEQLCYVQALHSEATMPAH
eukprot:m.123962 g.123962  ORF g.123962 m.123962 type:complete len:69 (+) comp13482_c0_seq3:2269-2475(+)